MQITPQMSDDALLHSIGSRLSRIRLAKNISQAQLAEQAGVGVRTVQRLEAGTGATHLSGFLRVCRVLDLVERLNALVPEEADSPMAQLRLHRARRQRASGPKMAKIEPEKWKWGE